MGRLIDLFQGSKTPSQGRHPFDKVRAGSERAAGGSKDLGSRDSSTPAASARNDGQSWDADSAVMVLLAAGAKSAALSFRFAMEVSAAWLDAAHQVAALWRGEGG
jgi:hypothetical protein